MHCCGVRMRNGLFADKKSGETCLCANHALMAAQAVDLERSATHR